MMRRAKIVATLGPATDSPERIAELIEAGVNVIRLNLSHGSHEDHARRVAIVRSLARKVKKPIAILLDLQGPKIRTGKLKGGAYVQLVYGQPFVITTREVEGTSQIVGTTYQALPGDVRAGNRVLLSDGLIELQVQGTTETDVETTVLHGGELRENQGINLPGVMVSAPSLTEKDVEDLKFGLDQGVDYVALSFVRKPEDIVVLREHISRQGLSTPVIAKIEKPEALAQLDEIMQSVDGVMVARGDLGVEMRPEQVPLIQKRIIRVANKHGVPVITATQMLESMIHNPRPTRAEASDVANAILDGTDAVMLSGETAVGEFPIEAVRIMARIAQETEQSMHAIYQDNEDSSQLTISRSSVAEAIAQAATAITQVLDVKAIIAFTQSGNTARLVAHNRPRVPILACTPAEAVYRRLSLIWGILPVICPFVERLDDLGEVVKDILIENGWAAPGDSVVLTGGHPLPKRGVTNLLKVMEV
jgi:pyruvate kinase